MGTSIVALVALVVGTCLFMVAGFIVCVGISIFCDSINIDGSFHGIAAKVIALCFVPILAAGRVLDLFLWFSVPEQVKAGLNSKV